MYLCVCMLVGLAAAGCIKGNTLLSPRHTRSTVCRHPPYTACPGMWTGFHSLLVLQPTWCTQPHQLFSVPFTCTRMFIVFPLPCDVRDAADAVVSPCSAGAVCPSAALPRTPIDRCSFHFVCRSPVHDAAGKPVHK